MTRRRLVGLQKLTRVAKLNWLCNGFGSSFDSAAVFIKANGDRLRGTDTVFGFPLIMMLIWKLLTVTQSTLLVGWDS